MAFTRKSKARKSPANRVRPRKSSPLPVKKTGRRCCIGWKETQALRKRGRPVGSGHAASSAVAAQLEAMSNELHVIPALREDEDLRVRVEELTGRIDELLRRPAEPIRHHPDDNQARPAPEPEPETAGLGN